MIGYDRKGKTCPLLFVVDLHRNVNQGNNTCFPGFGFVWVFVFFFLFQFIDKGEGILYTPTDISSFLHNIHVFFWL